MRILTLLDRYDTTAQPNSLQHIVAQTMQSFARAGHEQYILARRFSPDSLLRETIGGATVLRYDAASPLQAARAVAASTRELFAHRRFDLVHSHLAVCDAGARFAMPRGTPFVRTFHGSWPVEVWSENPPRRRVSVAGVKALARRALQERIERSSMHAAGAVIVLSAFSQTYIQREYRIAPERIFTGPGGVDGERYAPVADKAALRRALDIPPNRFVAVFAGRLIRWKGIFEVVAAIDIARIQDPSLLLVIAGSGKEEQALSAEVRRRGLEAYVQFAGFQRERLPQYYACADAVIVPSTREETFGMVTVEALSCGVPVIGNPEGATPEILRGVDSRLILAGVTPAQIAAKLQEIRQASWFANIAPASLHEFVRKNFSWERHLAAVHAAFDHVSAGNAH